MTRNLWLPAALATVLGLCELAAGDDDPRRCLVIYNTNFPDLNGNGIGDSCEVALYYKSRRGIPPENMLAVHCSQDFAYEYDAGWTAFFNEIVEPLRGRLTALGEEEIFYFVASFGVPEKYVRTLGVFRDRAIDHILAYPWNIGTADDPNLPKRSWPSPYLEKSPGVPPDNGHFDHTFKYLGYNMYLATRLSGPTAEHALDLVERAMYGERYLWPSPGYFRGTLYIDTQYKAYTDAELQGYPFGYTTYGSCDMSIAYSKFFAAASGYDWLWENTSTELEIGDPGATYHTGAPADAAPDALFYAGWYNILKYNDVWEWLPGSAACDFDSLSILGTRDEVPPSFLANAFLKGLTCGTGVIFEPETVGHQRPEVFFYAMLNGFNFAEAAGLATPTLCFSNMSVGDALYNPHRAGKVPEVDVAPPPIPSLRVLAEPGVDTEREVALLIDPRGREPDVVTAEVDFGLFAGYGSTAVSPAVFRLSHTCALAGLAPKEFYHFRGRVSDPAGLVAETGDFILYTEQPDPVIVTAAPKAQSVAQGAPFELRFHVSSKGGVGKITGYEVTLTALHLGVVDRPVTGYFAGLPFVRENDPEHTTHRYVFSLPGIGISGTYTFKVLAVRGGSDTAEDTCDVDVL